MSSVSPSFSFLPVLMTFSRVALRGTERYLSVHSSKGSSWKAFPVCFLPSRLEVVLPLDLIWFKITLDLFDWVRDIVF
jgi:hypothetical protein